MAVDPSKIKAGDTVHLSGMVKRVDRVRIDGLPFTVTLDGGIDVSVPEEAVVHHDRKYPTTPDELRAMPIDAQNKIIERWIRKST